MNDSGEVIAYLQGLRTRFAADKDRRGVFVAAYLEVSEAVAAGLRSGAFRDAVWAERYMTAFGSLYREALEAYDAGAACPKAWRIAFDAARRNETAALQDLLLGVNAHINNDLPLALVRAGIDPRREDRHADHDAVNDILEKVTDRLQRSVAEQYAPVLKLFDFAAGRADEALANFSVRKARAGAWNKAVLLADTSGAASDIVARIVAGEAAVLARLIRMPTAANPALLAALRRAEQSVVLESLA